MSSAPSAFAAIAFEDRAKAERNLQSVMKRLPGELAPALASLCEPSPDPDGALNWLERYTQAAPAEVLGDLAREPRALNYLVAIFGYSGFLAESFLAEPTLPIQFARDRHFTKLKSKEELMQDYARFTTTHPDHWLSSQFARFKRRNYLRIVLKDILGLSTLGETTLELSTLADVLLANALEFCDQELAKRYGRPQYRDPQGRIARSGFAIVSLGKLGGNELNYSSDIDLLFLYGHDGETAGTSQRDSGVSNKEYFVRLAHAVTRTITQPTPHGEVFRVDLRLRPEGESGDLAISRRSALEYYEHRARPWELQMLIKARHSAGDAGVTREFLRRVEPFVYSSPTDFAAVEAVLGAREKISRNLGARRGDSVDVKRHPGGIRAIEFLAQCLQRLYGGEDPWVRSGGTLLALRKLNDKRQLSDRDYAALVNAYELLRKAEHRVQFEQGRQTHRLPREPAALARLARRMGIEHPESAGAELERRIEAAFAQVEEIHQRVVNPRAAEAAGAPYELEPGVMLAGEAGLDSYETLKAFLNAQAPELGALLPHASVPERSRQKYVRFFSALACSSERFRTARESPERVAAALRVIGSSDYLADLLIRHPEHLAVLAPATPQPSSPPAEPSLATARSVETLIEPFPWVWEAGIHAREKMALLRRHFQSSALDLGARDFEAMDSIFAALQRWSLLAARSIASALAIASRLLDESSAPMPASEDESPLMVLALGRLGLNEFALASDADLIFVLAGDAEQAGPDFWTRRAAKTIEALSSYTREGAVLAVDTRLRPHGQEGDLVVTENALLSYVREEAQAWEAATYLKAWPVAGNFKRARAFREKLFAAVVARFALLPGLEGQLQEMRRRLEREVQAPPSDTKTAPGGYYDVDFALSTLRLRHRLAAPAGANTLDQIAALRAAGLLSEDDARALEEGATFLRSVDHAVRLVTGKAAEGLPEHTGHIEVVEHLARRWRLVAENENLADRLHEIQQQVRYVYRRTIGAD